MSLNESIKNLADKLKSTYLQALSDKNIADLVLAFREVRFPDNITAPEQIQQLAHQIIKELDLPKLSLSNKNTYISRIEEYYVSVLCQAYQFYKLNLTTSEIHKTCSKINSVLSTEDLFKRVSDNQINFISDTQVPMNYTQKLHDITEHMSRLKESNFDRDNLKDKKIRALCDLNSMLMDQYGKKSPQEIINEWKNKKSDGISTNYFLVSEHRQTEGIYKFFAKLTSTISI
ncbi:hypothetical protein ACFORL_11620 [Legionella dresdenensis]|uniref:Uncharacterized protein n=1 Tax=Legionella dresdenensis TaxID=450200 RepID=A0ABV8CHB0_9GAMM